MLTKRSLVRFWRPQPNVLYITHPRLTIIEGNSDANESGFCSSKNELI